MNYFPFLVLKHVNFWVPLLIKCYLIFGRCKLLLSSICATFVFCSATEVSATCMSVPASVVYVFFASVAYGRNDPLPSPASSSIFFQGRSKDITRIYICRIPPRHMMTKHQATCRSLLVKDKPAFAHLTTRHFLLTPTLCCPTSLILNP